MLFGLLGYPETDAKVFFLSDSQKTRVQDMVRDNNARFRSGLIWNKSGRQDGFTMHNS